LFDLGWICKRFSYPGGRCIYGAGEYYRLTSHSKVILM
jgi:hypothetical protein